MILYEKGQARLYTNTSENIEKIKNIIREVDKWEYEYLPKNFITIFNKESKTKNTLVYNGKFYDININEVIKKCIEQNIPITGDSTDIDGYECVTLKEFVYNAYKSKLMSKNESLKFLELEFLI